MFKIVNSTVITYTANRVAEASHRPRPPLCFRLSLVLPRNKNQEIKLKKQFRVQCVYCTLHSIHAHQQRAENVAFAKIVNKRRALLQTAPLCTTLKGCKEVSGSPVQQTALLMVRK